METHSSDRPAKSGVLIVGAGLAGLTLALALAKKGIRTTVIEKQKEIAPSKWTILLYPQGMKIFDELGILSEITALALPLKAPRIETVEGEVLAELETGKLFEERLNYSLGMGPSEIIQVLLANATAMGVEVLQGLRYAGLMRDGAGRGAVTGARVIEDGHEFTISSRLLVGADGYKSRVRSDFGARIDVKEHAVLVGQFVDCEHDQDRFRMVLGDGYYVVVYPWTKDRLSLGFGEHGLVEDELARKGGVDYARKKILDTLPFLAQAFGSGRASFVEGSTLTISPQEVRVSPWAVDGGILVGDAAHAFHPGTGQGAQQAFVDGITLAPIIQDCLIANDFSQNRLDEFEHKRRPLIRLFDSASTRTLAMETAKGPFNRWSRNRFFRTTGKLIKEKWFQEVFTGLRPPTRREAFKVLLAVIT